MNGAPHFDVRTKTFSISFPLITMELIIPSDIFIQGFVSVSCRTCVNGTTIESLVHLWHGDRILWGNNHFFRYGHCHSETPNRVAVMSL